MNKTTVHIQKKQRYSTEIEDKVTLCDQHLYHLPAEDGSITIGPVVNFVTLRDADIMAGVCRTKNGKVPRNIRRSNVLPPISGPDKHRLYIPDIDWCEDCFDHPSRALALLAQTGL